MPRSAVLRGWLDVERLWQVAVRQLHAVPRGLCPHRRLQRDDQHGLRALRAGKARCDRHAQAEKGSRNPSAGR